MVLDLKSEEDDSEAYAVFRVPQKRKRSGGDRITRFSEKRPDQYYTRHGFTCVRKEGVLSG
jgi:hypothetical protein